MELFLKIFVTLWGISLTLGHGLKSFSEMISQNEHILGPVCSNDCRTFMVYRGEKIPYRLWLCQDYSSKDTPYCVDNMCTSEPDERNPNCTPYSPFRCTGEGLYPDPTDCKFYYDCAGVNKPSTLYKCDTDYTFSSITGRCEQGLDCAKIDCTNKTNKLVAYKQNKHLYAWCSADLIVMFKCTGNINFWFNEITHECEFMCPNVGQFEDINDCRKYYHCNVAKQKGDLRECQPGKYFNDGACVYGNCSKD